MKRWLLLSLCLPLLVFADAANHATIRLEKVSVNLNDQAAIMRGAKFFAQQCMVCHTMKYLTHDKIAEAAGITLDKMPLKNKEWWLDIVPPDLTLEARMHSADWLYTYFHAFYVDPKRPAGSNNLVKPDVNMQNVFAPFQGEQQLIAEPTANQPYYAVLKRIKTGSMTQEQFDQLTKDLVTFLVYASDPHQQLREYIGWGVLAFLLIWFVVAVRLFQSYKKD